MVDYTTSNKNTQVSCFMTGEEYKLIKERSKIEERSVSNYVRYKLLKEGEDERD